ncbi:glycosyltransferase [Spirosoma pollinicola]|uniref:Glycosyltransferase family 1 protein n=1 Tax=Spirosoma pollinicola TaxID=2057025 RepID=A0A2K8Z241_9BACT|nr:glycosyltransferase [Spirosoma pollinicola]AUD03952.1 glycosyltransferase family 1 protein [Spirosoma pollinicola]
MRILIVHNLLWAHYKASVFQALQHLVDQQPDLSIRVLQIARNERSRASLETATDADTPTYTYQYELLFDRFLEDISLTERAQALLRHARAYKPDVINLTGYYDPAQLLLLAWAKLNGIRVVMQNESTAADHQRSGWKELFKRSVFRACDGFFCFGSQSADYLIQLGVPPAKILLRKNAVDNEALRAVYEQTLPNRTRLQQSLHLQTNNFVFVGRLIEVKNLPMLLNAFAEALKRSVNALNWGLILLGDGDQWAELSQQIGSLKLTDRVTLLPGRPWFRVPEVLALSNVLVLPSRSEPWGLVVNEAMVCGLPVIVSERCGCVQDLVHPDETGFVFDPEEPDKLTQLMVKFMDDLVDTQRMAYYAQQYIAPYAPDVVAQEMLDGFREITN